MRVDQDVLEVLDRATIKGGAVTLNGQLERKLYERVNKVLAAAGGKWERRAGAHLFPGDVEETLEQVILTGEIISAKQEFGAFFTPPAVADRMKALAGVEPGMLALEPSAGEGALAKMARQCGAEVTCYDILQKHVDHLRLGGFQATQADFLEVDPVKHAKYDRVVMNPPFAGQADVRHVIHARRFLVKGGVLVAVMSAAAKFRDNMMGRNFRSFLESFNGEIWDLPAGAFKASGTMVNTVLVRLRV